MTPAILETPGARSRGERAEELRGGVPEAVIAGVGLLTPLGRGVGETWDALLGGRYIEDHSLAAGESDRSNDAGPRVVRMAERVAAQAMAEAGWVDLGEAAVVVGTSKGSVESWLTPLQHMAGSTCEAGGSNSWGLADIAAHLARGGQGPRLTLSGACASGLMALIRATMMIRGGEAKRVLVVAAEASVHPLFLGSFKRLGVLPGPGVGCRPFDEGRDGFLMSEAAAAVCLEAGVSRRSEESDPAGVGVGADSSGVRVAVDRVAMNGDGAHLTASDPDGRVLRHLINRVVDGRPVDLVHAHGTGTPTNDPIELAAIEAVLKSTETSTPCLYSHKGALGHSLGAAGLVAVVLNMLAHRRGVVPPNVRTTRPLPTRRVSLSEDVVRRPVGRSVAVAAGFGGAMAAVSLKTL